ncbi:unnamed protein product [Adineta steineri]|uniref:Uncharacterized protein n=1 Tax=Adineta steineri TaxID=433720 RepID=A0A815FDP6_9BILA|nr:unnamed protein product [Adineta steineri]
MFILFIFFLINHSQSLEWNCTENQSFLFSNDQTYEQCTITIEYISLQQQKQLCITHTLSIKNLPIFSYSSNYTMKICKINSCQLLTLNQLSFSLPSSVEILDLSYNLLSTFTFSSYSLPSQLKYLYLDNNPNLIDINFNHDSEQHQQLVSLSLRHNKNMKLSFLPLNLIQLDLTDCNLLQSSILILLKSLTKLTHLSLANNRLKRLPILDRSIQLEYLNLSNNYLTSIEDDWLYKSLQILDLTFNQIESLEFFKGKLKINQTLQLYKHDRINKMVTHPLQLSLHGNPLICDCWLDSLLNSSSINITDLSLLQCNSHSIQDISPNDLQCSYTRYCAPDCSCCDFEACDCHSVCPSECLCSHNAFWSHHLVKCQQGNLSDIHIFLPETITELNYEGNNIEQIKPFVFAGKNLLTKLNLAKNNIQYFTNETFCAASNLREIDLSYNSNLMTILPYINELFECLKNLQYIILSSEQFKPEDAISYGWIVSSDKNLIRIRRKSEQLSSVSPLNITRRRSTISSTFHSETETSPIFSIFHHESFTSSNIIHHNQTLIVIVFFLLFFVLLFLLLLISLAICRRKLRHHITAELERQQSQHYYYHTHLHQPITKMPENIPVNDSLYEQLPSLSSDSEQPFLYNEKKLTNINAPALPPYPPSLRHYHCCHSTTPHDYLSTIQSHSSSSNLEQQQQSQSCQAVLILGNQLIYPNHQECLSDLQQNLLLTQQENNTMHYCNNETVFVPTTLCRCKSQLKNINTYTCPNVYR